MNNNLIITIGREYGSGGREIGETLAKRLGIKWYDKELLTVSAEKSGFSQRIFEQYDETAQNSLLYSLAMGLGSPASPIQPLSVQLYLEQFNAIREIAQKESCVFIGRCSDYALRGRENVVNVFVHAPLPDRIQRICRRHQVDEAKAKDMIQKKDKARANYYNYYTKQKWGSTRNYDLTFDTSKVGIDGAVELILRFCSLSGKVPENGPAI